MNPPLGVALEQPKNDFLCSFHIIKGKSGVPAKKKWKYSGSWWVHTDHRARWKSGCLLLCDTKTIVCIHLSGVQRQIRFCALHVRLYFGTLFTAKRICNCIIVFFLFQRGHRFWRLPMWQSVHIRPLCMQFVFHLIGVWQSACPPGLLPVRRRQTHALSHTHTVIKQNRAVWRYVPRDRRCGTRLEANFDLVHSYNWCSAANVQNKEDNAANKTEPTGSCYTEKNSPTWRGRKWTITD